MKLADISNYIFDELLCLQGFYQRNILEGSTLLDLAISGTAIRGKEEKSPEDLKKGGECIISFPKQKI